MATAAYEVAHLSEQFDVESPTSAAPRRRGRWLVAGVGLALAIAGCMGVAVGVARANKPASPLEHLSTIRKRLVKAFSSRALQEQAELHATSSIVWNELGAEDPTKMGVDVVFQQQADEDEEEDEMALKFVFLAQENKGEDLKSKFDEIWNAFLDDATQHMSEEEADAMKTCVKISVGETDEVVLLITPPPSDEEKKQEEELASGIDGSLKFQASLYVGRTIKEMYDKKDTNVLLLPNGIKVKMDMFVAAKLIQAIFNLENGQQTSDDPSQQAALMYFGLIKSLAKVKQEEQFFYKTEDKLNGALDDWPNLEDGINAAFGGFFGEMPGPIRESLAGLEDLADGVKTFELLGLPDKWEVKATFSNFHIAPLIATCLEDFKAAAEE